MEKRYIVGIDLGTTNCAVGYIDLYDASPGSIQIKSFDIPQLVGMGRLGMSKTLPSFLFLPPAFDVKKGVFALPWDEKRDYAVGVYARDHGALVPGRLVSSAKSWLCHGGVDRDAPILPWGSREDVKKVSPVTASSRYLQHIKEAWEYEMGLPLSEQEVVLTVPASFDQVARELTLKAAQEAGLEHVILLEEPLASFYAWLSHHEQSWQDHIRPGQLLLVCDVGGGTTDFTLIACEKGDSGPRLERLAVGNHLLLGGDNIDLAIAALCEKKIGRSLSQAEWQNLFHQARQAKEALLSRSDLERTSVRLVGTGKSLVAGTVSVSLDRAEIESIILDGFFPELDFDSAAKGEGTSSALREMGLPYESDPAVTRHLARFLSRQGHGRLPDIILFNGGTLKPLAIRHRVSSVLSSWKGGEDVLDIENESLDLAISVGAVYYGLVRKGLGLRVGGGVPRAYFIGLTGGKVKDSKEKALCLIERGTEEGQEVEIDRRFEVLTNRPVKFSLFSSTVRQNDHVGDLVEINAQDFVRLPPLQTVLKYGRRSQDKKIPVKVGSKITTIGTLELYCRSLVSPHRWRLQFDLRADRHSKRPGSYQVEGVRVALKDIPKDISEQGLTEEDRQAISRAEQVVKGCFIGKGRDSIAPKELGAALSEIFGMGKELWSLGILRALSDIFIEVKAGRKRSLMHEASWFNLTGFCMRPGFGDPADPWRIKKIWPLSFEGLSNVNKLEARLQWWIFWRRVAGGLSSGQQVQLFAPVLQVLVSGKRSRRKKKTRLFKPVAEEAKQMWLLAGNMERLEINSKEALGSQAISILQKSPFKRDLLWALGRLGARIPLYGPANKVVPASVVIGWIEALKRYEFKKELAALINCVVSMARICGDRARDLPEKARQDIALWLELLGARPDQISPLKELREIEQKERDRAFGEHLPEGLILSEEDVL